MAVARVDASVPIWAAPARSAVKFVPLPIACPAALSGPDTSPAGTDRAELNSAPRLPAFWSTSPFHNSPNWSATEASGPVKMAFMLAESASEFPSRAAWAPPASSARPLLAATAPARYTCA
jgi:hypothetical protein